MSDSVLVEFEAVRFRYGSTRSLALEDLSFRIERGTVVGLIGPNGSGKTTLYRLLMGFVRPSAGSVKVGGIAPSDYRVRSGVGYLPEQVRLPANVRVREFGLFMARLARLSHREIAPTVDRLLEALAIGDKADCPIGSLSHGYRQRVGLLATLLGEPELILWDEPATGLDPGSIGLLRSALRALKRRGRTVVVASHNLRELERACDVMFILRDGQLLGRCTQEGLARRPEVWVVQLRAAGMVKSSRFDALCTGLSGVRLASDEAGFTDARRAREFARRVTAVGGAVETIERRPFDLEYMFHSLVQGELTSAGGNDGRGC